MTHNFQPVQRQPSPGKARGEDNVNEFSVISDIFPVQNSEFTLVGDGDDSQNKKAKLVVKQSSLLMIEQTPSSTSRNRTQSALQ